MNDRPSAQRRISGLRVAVIQPPSAPARPWFTTVEPGCREDDRYRFLARCEDEGEELVLSPISARATTPVETRRGFHAFFPGRSADD